MTGVQTCALPIYCDIACDGNDEEHAGHQEIRSFWVAPYVSIDQGRERVGVITGRVTYKGVLTMVDGDFSAAVGTWKDANGNTVTVSGNGQFTVQSADGKTDNYSIASYSYTLDDGKYNAQLSGQGNANLQITTGADGSVTSVVVTQP